MPKLLTAFSLVFSTFSMISISFAETEIPVHITPEMIFLPGGITKIGSLIDVVAQPVHEETIPPFFIGKFEVTFNEFDKFSKATSKDPRHDIGWGRGKRPVVGVSWYEAKQYASWLSEMTGEVYRLPTEAEWEYAARAGEDIARFSWGNDVAINKANCRDCRNAPEGLKTAIVGTFSPNGFGLYDVHGNVWEMVSDCYSPSYFEKNSNNNERSQSDCKSIIVRGGSWETDSNELASWFRGAYLKDTVSSDVGFRLVKEAD
jgi:formylglycine-generating enzyme required for sulfatase activity